VMRHMRRQVSPTLKSAIWCAATKQHGQQQLQLTAPKAWSAALQNQGRGLQLDSTRGRVCSSTAPKGGAKWLSTAHVSHAC
jgi:hypothetical protein